MADHADRTSPSGLAGCVPDVILENQQVVDLAVGFGRGKEVTALEAAIAGGLALPHPCANAR